MIVLPLAYLGNVQYFSKLCFGQDVVVDVHEHFVKQSLRSRCEILTPNGPATLSVNVVKEPNDRKCSVRDTRIDYSKRWQHRHWVSLVSAYRSSPYFEHYAERFAPFYERRYEWLFDLDSQLTVLLLELLDSPAPLRFSQKYIPPSDDILDLRHALSEKPRLQRSDPHFSPAPYWQVFAGEAGFMPNLSVVDVLFCEGPGALDCIRRSVVG